MEKKPDEMLPNEISGIYQGRKKCSGIAIL
jgi:hypothetical protein